MNNSCLFRAPNSSILDRKKANSLPKGYVVRHEWAVCLATFVSKLFQRSPRSRLNNLHSQSFSLGSIFFNYSSNIRVIYDVSVMRTGVFNQTLYLRFEPNL